MSFSKIEKAFLELKGISIYKTQKKATEKLIKYGGIEVNTGEGKSIISVATALTLLMENKSEKVFIVTVNDYLAKRDYYEMKPVFDNLNISISLNLKENYNEVMSSSVVYTSVSQLMFLYLNSILNNLAYINLDSCIIDEADYTLIDCANTGCTISQGQDLSFLSSIPLFKMAFAISNNLKGAIYIDSDKDTLKKDSNVDFYIDIDNERVFLSEKGFCFIEKILKKDLTTDITLHSIIINVLKAKFLYKKGSDYIVKEDKIIWIDKNNKRLMKSCKRELLLQIALELKENVTISSKGVEEISLSYQVFFYLFKNLYLLSATLNEVKDEVKTLYGVSIKKIEPRTTQKIKINNPVFLNTTYDKYNRVLSKIKETMPYPIVLFEENDNEALKLYEFLNENNIKANLLISSNYEQVEDEVIAKAGEKNKVLITTPICSRGVDIKLTDNNKSKGLTSVILFNPPNNRILRQIIGRVGRNGVRGEVNQFIDLSKDIHLKKLSHIPLNKRLKEKQIIIKKQLSKEKDSRYSEFIIDKLLFDKYQIALELSKNTDIKKLATLNLDEYELELFNKMCIKEGDVVDKVFERIYVYNLNTTFSNFKELIKKISNENSIHDVSYKGVITFEYRLNKEFNSYINDLALLTIKALINTKNIIYKKR